MYTNGIYVLKDLKIESRFPLLSKTLHSQTDCSVENMSGKKSKDMCNFFKIFFGLIFPKWSLLFLFCLRVTYSWNWPKEVSELGPFSTVSHELGGEHQAENFIACCCWGALRGEDMGQRNFHSRLVTTGVLNVEVLFHNSKFNESIQ